jgi:hypothetical protein
MSNFTKDKTISHYHTDPKLIEQENIGLVFTPGQLLYLDDDGVYKLAIATSEKESNVIGMVWSILGPNHIYLKVEPTPCQYDLPLGENWFNVSGDGKVVINSPNDSKIPGSIGQILFLSETVAGGIQDEAPNIAGSTFIVGYKTKYGFLYRPERVLNWFCSSSSSSSSS